jgi:hypothetical protein
VCRKCVGATHSSGENADRRRQPNAVVVLIGTNDYGLARRFTNHSRRHADKRRSDISGVQDSCAPANPSRCTAYSSRPSTPATSASSWRSMSRTRPSSRSPERSRKEPRPSAIRCAGSSTAGPDLARHQAHASRRRSRYLATAGRSPGARCRTGVPPSSGRPRPRWPACSRTERGSMSSTTRGAIKPPERHKARRPGRSPPLAGGRATPNGGHGLP